MTKDSSITNDDGAYSGRRIMGSAAWATAQQLVTAGSAALTGVLLARHLSVSEFGTYSYATTLAAMGTMVMTAGLSGLAIKALVNDRQHEARTMTALIVTRELFAVLAYVGFLLISFTSGDDVTVSVTAVALVVLFARALDASELWFQSRAESSKTAPIRIGAVLLAIAVRVIGTWLGFDLVVFVAIYVLEGVIISCCLLLRYYMDRRSPRFARPETQTPRGLLSDSWLLLVGGVASVINSRADIPILQVLSGSVAVGLYSAAARLSEVFYFLPVVFMNAYFPRLLKIRRVDGADSAKYRKELQRAYDLACWAGISITLMVLVIGPWVITLLYGEAYAEAGGVLRLHVLALPFMFMAAVFSKWILAEGLLVASLLRHVLGAVLNIALNFALIPIYGIYGAGIATVVSYTVASYLSCFATRKTRPAGIQMTLAFVWPIRLLVQSFNRMRTRRPDGED